jgi:GAF domain-containing protein
MVRVDDMAAEQARWPRFAPEALRHGITSMLSLQLPGDSIQVAALNLYATHGGVFDLAAQATARLFADQAAIALHGAQQVAERQRALASRDVIGQAKGILIERHHLASSDDAFAMLVEASQHANVKLRDVATWLVTDATTARSTTTAATATPEVAGTPRHRGSPQQAPS